jgi:hypothetical protein
MSNAPKIGVCFTLGANRSRFSGIIRARSSSIPARPYMAHLSVFNRLICHSCPLLHGSSTAFRTAPMS